MKKVLLWILICTVAGLAWIGVKRWHDFHNKSSLHPQEVTTAKANPTGASASAMHSSPLMAGNEWQQYRSARLSALQANPALQSEYNDILQKMDGQQAKFDAAMLKADPKLAPVMTKLQALRVQHAIPSPSLHSPASSPTAKTPAADLTAEEWQELRTARNEALQANPDLSDTSKKLAVRMRNLEDKLDAAMIKADPNLAPIITKFEAGRGSQAAFAHSSPSK